MTYRRVKNLFFSSPVYINIESLPDFGANLTSVAGARESRCDNGFDIVYKVGEEKRGIVYVAIESIEKTRGTLVDIGYDIGFYEEGETKSIRECLEAALKEYTKDISHCI